MCNATETVHTCGHNEVTEVENCHKYFGYYDGHCPVTLHTHHADTKCWRCAIEDRKEEKKREREEKDEREREEAYHKAMMQQCWAPGG